MTCVRVSYPLVSCSAHASRCGALDKTGLCYDAGLCNEKHHVCGQGSGKRACACAQLGSQLALAPALVLLLLLLPMRAAAREAHCFPFLGR